MFLDFGWSEMLLIGVVALIFIGPKDLPKALKVAGFWVRKARTLSREFQSSIDQMIREAELDDIRRDLKKATEFDLDKEFQQTIDPTGSLAEGLRPPELPNFAEPDRPAASAAEGAVAPAAEAIPGAPAEIEPRAVAGSEPVALDMPSPEIPKSQISGPEIAEPEIGGPGTATSMVVPRDGDAYEYLPPKP